MQAYLHSETMRVVPTYLILGTVALLWALMVLVTRFPDTPAKMSPAKMPAPLSTSACSSATSSSPSFAQFLYVGAQVGTWSYFILYVARPPGWVTRPPATC